MFNRSFRAFVLVCSPLSVLAGPALAGGDPDQDVIERPARVVIEEQSVEPQSTVIVKDPVRASSTPVVGVASGGQAAAGPFEADRSLNLRLSDDVATLSYERDAAGLGVDNGRVQAGFLLSEQRDTIFTGTLMVDTRPGLIPQVRLSVGTRAYAALLGVENRDVIALGLGVEGFYSLPIRVLPLELSVGGYYAPDVLAFGQADRIIEWNVDVGLRLRDRLAAFVGFHFLQVDTRPGDREVDDEIHVGLRWTLDDAGDAG